MEMDRADLSARVIADQPGQAKMSMTQDRYLDRAHRETRKERDRRVAGP